MRMLHFKGFLLPAVNLPPFMCIVSYYSPCTAIHGHVDDKTGTGGIQSSQNSYTSVL